MKIFNKDDNIIFEDDSATIRETVENAVKAKADLTGANLAGADLAGANLTGANLKGADLAEADLYKADLTGAYLDGAYLPKANPYWVKRFLSYLPNGNGSTEVFKHKRFG